MPDDKWEEFEDISVYSDTGTKRGWKVAVIILSVLVVLLLAGLALLLFGGKLGINLLPTEPTTAPTTQAVTSVPTTTQPVTTEPVLAQVPNVIGMNARDAYDDLNAAGVKYTIQREYSDTVAAEYVISQSPTEGAISADQKVMLYISKGPEKPAPTAAPATEATKKSDKQSSSSSGHYVLDGSDSRLVQKSELSGMNEKELTLALNEIYARHGRRFKSTELQQYFDAQSWYRGTISPERFDDNVLTEIEEANVRTILAVMAEKGYR